MRIISVIFIGIIRLYQQLISPLFMPRCRYTPTCSEYALNAIKKYGSFRGGWLTIKRVLKCHPFGGNGYDPVP